MLHTALLLCNMKTGWKKAMFTNPKFLKIKRSCFKKRIQRKGRNLHKTRQKTKEQSKNSEDDREIIKDGIGDAEIDSKCVSVGKIADDQQNCTVNSISLKIKPKYSNSLQSKPNINCDMNLKCLKTNECFVFKNTAVKTKSTLIVNSNESKSNLLYSKYANATSCKNDLFPTVYSCNFTTLVGLGNSDPGANFRIVDSSGNVIANESQTIDPSIYNFAKGISISYFYSITAEGEDVIIVLQDRLFNNPIMRTGPDAEVIWIKLISYTFSGAPCILYDFVNSKDKLIFKLDLCQDSLSSEYIFTKMDTNGNFLSTLRLKSFQSSTSFSQIIAYHFIMGSNQDLLLSTFIKQSNNTNIGFIYSELYPSIIRTDGSGNTLWTCTLLYNHTDLVYQNKQLEKENVYVSSLSPNAILCYSIINYNTGNFTRNQCYQLINDLAFNLNSINNLQTSTFKINEDYLGSLHTTLMLQGNLCIFFSQSDLQIIKIHYIAMSLQPTSFYIDQGSQKFCMFFVTTSLFAKADFNSKTLNLNLFKIYSRNDDFTLYSQILLNIIIMNPLNSTSCDTDSSCYLKIIGSLVIYDSQIGQLNALYMDKFNFKFEGTYCNPLQTAQLIDLNHDLNSIEEVQNLQNQYQSVNMNYQIQTGNSSVFSGLVSYIVKSEYDLQGQIWPSISPYLYGSCHFDMPSFLLSSASYLIAVGSNSSFSNQVYTHIPFSHCRSSEFYFTICINGANDTCSQPNWISINNTNKSFSILVNQVTSVGLYNAKFQAILQVPYKLTNLTQYSSTFGIDIQFTNSNAYISELNSSVYVIIGKMKNFTISCADNEGDRVLMNIADSGTLNTFLQRYQSNSTFLLIVLANQEVTNTQTEIALNFTDSYHQASLYWIYFTITVNIFSSEPLRYLQPLQNINISACDCINVKLPTAFDPDGDSFTVGLDSKTIEWISLIDSNTLSICPSDANITKNQQTQSVFIILKDTTGSKTINNFIVSIDTSMLINFNIISDVNMLYLQTYELKPNVQNTENITLINCLDFTSVPWANFNSTSKTISINPTNPSLVGTHCVQISAIDGCAKINYSNCFNIKIKFKNPPVFLSQIGQLSLMKGEGRLFKFSKSMIFDEYPDKLIYNIYFVSGSVGNKFPKVTLTFDLNNFFIFVEGTVVGNFKAMLSVTDIVGQITETPVSITVFNCASKDCIKCSGPYQHDCSECDSLFEYNSMTGECIFGYYYWPNSVNVYEFIGIIIFLMLIINCCFYFKLKRISLLSLKYIQIMMIFLLSSNNANQNNVDLMTMMHVFDFNFEFFSPNSLNRLLQCQNDSKKMQNVHFYCTSTLANYKCTISIIILGFVLYLIMKLLKRSVKLFQDILDFLYNFKIFCCIKDFQVTKYELLWIAYNLLLPFLSINLIYDLMAFKNHYIIGIISVLIILLIVIFHIVTKCEYLKPSFILQMDPTNPYVYTYLDFGRTAVHVCLFVFGDSTNYRAWILIAFLVNCLIVLVKSSEHMFKKFGSPLTELQNKERVIHIYGESWALFIIAIISNYNYFLSDDNAMKFISSMMLLFFIVMFVFSLVLLMNPSKTSKLTAKQL